MSWERIETCVRGLFGLVALDTDRETIPNLLTDELNALVPLPGGSMLQFLALASQPGFSRVSEPQLRELAGGVQRLFDIANRHGFANTPLGLGCAGAVRTLGEEHARIQAARSFVWHIGTMAADVYLDQLLEAGALLLHGTRGWRDQQSLDSIMPRHGASVRDNLKALLARIRLQLLNSTSAPLAIHRLATWLSRFERRRLLAEVRTAGGLVEQLIQSRIDSFLFQEGFFPITHCDVGGQTDTVAMPEPMTWIQQGLEEAAEARQVPIVIELKQVLVRESASEDAPDSTKRTDNMPVAEVRSAARVRDAVRDATAQIHSYLEAFHASPSWQSIKPWVLVVYGGPQRYWLAKADQIRLIYVGGCPPSRTRKLELE